MAVPAREVVVCTLAVFVMWKMEPRTVPFGRCVQDPTRAAREAADGGERSALFRSRCRQGQARVSRSRHRGPRSCSRRWLADTLGDVWSFTWRSSNCADMREAPAGPAGAPVWAGGVEIGASLPMSPKFSPGVPVGGPMNEHLEAQPLRHLSPVEALAWLDAEAGRAGERREKDAKYAALPPAAIEVAENLFQPRAIARMAPDRTPLRP